MSAAQANGNGHANGQAAENGDGGHDCGRDKGAGAPETTKA